MKSEAMSDPSERQAGGLGFFGRYLTLWVALCMGGGVALAVRTHHFFQS